MSQAILTLLIIGVFFPWSIYAVLKKTVRGEKAHQEPQEAENGSALKITGQKFFRTARLGGHWRHSQRTHDFIVPNLVSKDSLQPCERKTNLPNNQSHTVLKSLVQAFSTFPFSKYHYRIFLVHLFSGTWKNHHHCFPLPNWKLRRKSRIGRLKFPIFEDGN